MSIINTIKERKSVRSYTGEGLTKEQINKIELYVKSLSAPLESVARIELISNDIGNHPIKLGTYGIISGAKHFLALIVEDKPNAEIGASYIFEQTILYCTELGLGTCWLGATFKQRDFLSQIKLEEDERLAIISPVGYKREKRRLLDTIMRTGARSDNRKPFESLFFNNNFETPLNKAESGDYTIPLEMLRLAPSASNKQPWRIIKSDKNFHFYHKPNPFSLIDMGIALCHFDLTCKELMLQGYLKKIENIPSYKGYEYLVSWVSEQ